MNILLIRLRMIGDVVFTTPAIRALRRRYPDARISYLVEDAAAPVVQGNPHLDEVLVIPLTTGLGRIGDDWRIGADLRRRQFDLVIDFHGGPRGSWLSWLTRAPQRIGYTVPGRSWMYTQAVARPRQLRPRHSVENQWDLLAAIGIDAPDRTLDSVEMPERADVRARVDARLAVERHRRGRPGSRHARERRATRSGAGRSIASRQWPRAWSRTIQPRFVVLTSGPSDAGAADEAAREAQQQLPSEPGVPDRAMRRVRPAGVACAGRARRALHRRRQRAAAHRRNHRGRRWWGCMARRCPCARRPGGIRQFRPRRSSGRTSTAGPATSADVCTPTSVA